MITKITCQKHIPQNTNHLLKAVVKRYIFLLVITLTTPFSPHGNTPSTCRPLTVKLIFNLFQCDVLYIMIYIYCACTFQYVVFFFFSFYVGCPSHLVAHGWDSHMPLEVQELHCDSPYTSFTSSSAPGQPNLGKKMNMYIFIFILQDISTDIFKNENLIIRGGLFTCITPKF